MFAVVTFILNNKCKVRSVGKTLIIGVCFRFVVTVGNFCVPFVWFVVLLLLRYISFIIVFSCVIYLAEEPLTVPVNASAPCTTLFLFAYKYTINCPYINKRLSLAILLCSSRCCN
jgi:hypothetical protein